MADFSIEIAGHTACIHSLFHSTRDYCRDYLTEQEPEFSISVTEADLRHEQALADEEARQEGFRLRIFTDPFLDRAAIQRKLADALFPLGILMIHGSAVAVDGQGYLFTAKSGTGKSTHTRLWREVFGESAVMINDDKPFISMQSAGIFLCGSPWSGKHGLHSNRTVPLAGICILERGCENIVTPISAEAAIPMLLHQSHQPEGQQEAFSRRISALAHSVPLWHMACTKQPEAALAAYRAMAK